MQDLQKIKSTKIRPGIVEGNEVPPPAEEIQTIDDY